LLGPEKGPGVASDVVKVEGEEGEDPATPVFLKETG